MSGTPPRATRAIGGVLRARVAPVVAALALVAAPILAAGGPPGASAGSERLPDLDQAVPAGLSITRAGSAADPVDRLGFRSAVANVGDGPLAITAR